jgi:CO dehydrogenase nickel-insertion accessory protein CooC1
LLGELEGEGRTVIADLEAGVGTVLRLQSGLADVVLVVAQPTAKAIEVARRAIEIATSRAQVVLVANRVTAEADVGLIRRGTGWAGELAVVPDDPAVAEADEEGVAPIDAAPDAPAVLALRGLARRLLQSP